MRRLIRIITALLLFLRTCLLATLAFGADLEEDLARQVVVWFYDATTQAPETGLTVTSITCRIVNDAMTTSSFSPTASGGSNDMVEIGNGAYRLELTAAQLGTVGVFELGCSISGSVSPPTAFNIVPTVFYDFKFRGDISSIADFLAEPVPGAATAGQLGYNIGTFLTIQNTYPGGVISTGTAQAGAAGSITLAAAASTTNDFYNFKRIVIMSGTGAGQSALITDYVGSTRVATTFCEGTTAGAWRVNPSTDSVYVILPRNR